MSRSRKKVAGFCDRCPAAKNYANRRIRRTSYKLTSCRNFDEYLEEFTSYKAYRKFSCPWDICDWRFLFFNDIALWREAEEELAFQVLHEPWWGKPYSCVEEYFHHYKSK